MKRLISWFNIIIKKRRELKRWHRIVTVLAAVITFATTYALILPAITVETDTAEDVGGMYLEQASDPDGMREDDTLEPTDVSINADQENAVTDAVKTLKATGDDYTVVLTYDESSKIPEGAFLTASEISQDSKEYMTYLEETKKAMGLTEEDTLPRFAARFFDIKIMVGDEEFSPKTGVSVEITYTEPLAEKADAEVSAVHFADEKADAEVIEANTTEIQDDGAATVEFTAESFSVYGVVYTVDFHYEVNGKMYEFSLPGGGFVSLSDLVEMLDIIGDTNSDNNGDEKWADIAGFVSCVESLEFTNPGLMDVSKAEADTTVGQIKESRELACEYSTELTEEQIEEINAQTVEAGDWALISLQPFLSEEMLTVTMNDGEIFTIMVTDAQIRRDVLTADGKTYTITLTYSPSAGIPDDADLVVREITEGEEFARYLSDSAAALRIADEDVSFARFFDIEIVDGAGEKVEPLEPVQVTIAYADAIESSGEESLNVVHFAETGTEVINEVSLSEDGSEITYEQSSFSVTGTIQTGAPTNGGYYMLLVDYNGKTYMVNNDGTLTVVTTGQDANGNPDPNKIAVEYPMLWTYYYQYGGHFRFASEASGFNADNTASGYYYKYIDPNSDAGLREEHKNGDPNNLVGQTVVTYHDNSISNAGYNKYIGVSEEGGALHIVGNTNASNAATIRLAAATNVLPSDPLKHSVNHIDIGFDASATVTVPMAYGEYTLRDASGNVVRNLTVDQDHTLDVTLEAGKGKENEIIILPDDMKNAEIKAYRQSDYNTYKDNPEELARHELNDAFYITGYSQNNTTDFSEMQVRVEGSFKAATDIPDADWRYYNRWENNYINWVKQQRLQHQVEYVVTLTKTVELPVTIDGYRVYDQDGIPLTVTVDIPMKDSFTYWDRRNECPPVQWDWSNWQSGDIATHGMSGMDFRLDGGNANVRADIVALNITKYIEDVNGNPIKVENPVTNKFEIYRDINGNPDTVKDLGSENVDYGCYAFYHLRNTEIKAGEDKNIVHDYQVTPGMYYIKEDYNSIPQEIQAYTADNSEGQRYTYVGTEILTEYVWRGGESIGMDDKQRLEKVHTSASYAEAGDSYTAIPDVLGPYTYEGNTHAPDENGTMWDLNNGFLEFYVINKYKPVQGDIPEPSEDTMNIQLDKKWDDNGNEEPPDDTAAVPFTLHQVRKTTTSGGGSASGIKVVLYDTDSSSPLATCYANPGDTLSLSFTSVGGFKEAHVAIYNAIASWGQSTPVWKEVGGYGEPGSSYLQTNGSGQIQQNMSYTVNNSDIYNYLGSEQISLRLQPGASLSQNFASAPSWVGATGSGGGSSTVVEEVDPEDSGYPKSVTLSNADGWSHVFANLPTKTVIPAENKTIEYSYYLVEGTPTGSASDFTDPQYKVYLDEEHAQESDKDASDQENAITGSGVTRYVEVTNKKASLIVKKEWRGEANPDAYPPISFQLYQGWKNGSGVSEGWLYSDETYTISAEDGWEKVFNNLPATATHDEQTGEVGYYVKEVVPGDDGTSWFSHVKINYESSAHSTMGDQNQPYNGGIGGNKGTLTIINTPPTYTQIHLIKQWFENNSGSWADITGDNNKTSNYAFGFIVQRAVKNEAAEPADGDYVDYGQEIVVSRNQVLVNDNQFTVVYSGSNWQFHVQGNNDPAQHENALVSEGYYEKSDGTKEWAQFAYRFKETYAYKLDTILNGTEVLPRDQWETQAWQPQYSSSGNNTIIRNYPIGSLDVTKDWQTEDPNLEIGSKIYFKVYRDGRDITPDIIEHPANYGLYSNQVYHDPEHPEHDSVVITSNGESFETVHLQGLVIGEPNSDQAHQYTVVEIGYSDQKNKDFWDDPLDTTDFEFLQGYVVDNGDDEQDCPGLTVDQLHTVYIKNLYKKTETEFAFTKVWQDSVGKGTNWQEPITVTLHQTKGDVAVGTDTPTGKTATFTVNPYGTTEQGEPLPRTFTFDGKTYEWKMEVSHEGSYYTFRIEHLPYKDGDEKIFSYYVTEEALGGYITSYAFKANETDPDLTIKVSIENPEKTNRALNGQYIINKQPGAALPNTGGPGTRLFTILGLTLALGAGVLLWRRRRLI